MSEKIITTKNNENVFKLFMALALPTVLEMLFGTILQYVDTAMVGHLGATATATVSLSSTYNWLINSIINALGIGFLSYIARAIGEKNDTKVKKAASQAFLVVVVVGLALTCVTMGIAPFMPAWMGAEEAIRKDASIYYAIVNLPLTFHGAMMVFGSVIRSTGDTKTPMKINVSVNILNVVLNYLFIYLLNMGAIGAGIATAIAYTYGGIMMYTAFSKRQILHFSVREVRYDAKVMRDCLNIGIPVMLTSIASCTGYIVATSFVSSMETNVYAAHSIAITAEQLFYIPGYGMQAAASTLVGNALGENNFQKQVSVIKLSLFTILGLMLISGMVLFVGAGFMMSLFTSDVEVITIGTSLLRIVAFTEPVFGAAAVMDGIYAGMGKTKYPLVIELITRWGIRILGSFIFIRLLNYGISQVWYCMIADNITKAVLLFSGILLLIHSTKKKMLG